MGFSVGTRGLRHVVASLVAVVLVLVCAPAAQAVLTGFSDRAPFVVAAGGSTDVINFDNFANGTQITNQLGPVGIASVSGVDRDNIPRGVFVTASNSMPFPMFTAGTLPSEPNFLSVDMNSPAFATGRITCGFPGAPKTAIGAFIADGGPLGNFSIEVFDGQTSLGSINVPPRTLPNSFVGVVSTQPFTSAVFFPNTSTDSWGLDNLEFAPRIPEPASATLLAIGAVGLLGRRRR